jgi:hypothetical protein
MELNPQDWLKAVELDDITILLILVVIAYACGRSFRK